jgi:sugar phosphate isomerase/epimerase
MKSNQSRRSFLKQTATLAAAGVGLASLPGCSTTRKTGMPDLLYKISLAEWSLHRTLQSGQLDNLDFPRTARQEFGIDAIEYVNVFFKDKATDGNYLKELKTRCEGEGVKSLLIMCDGEGALGDADAVKRTQAVENHQKWILAARYLDCHSIRVNAQSSGSYSEQMNLAADGLRRLSENAAKFGLNVVVENHGGLSSNGDWLSAVIRKVDLPNCGTLPDFGNFRLGDGKEYDRYLGVEQLMPYAKAVSAKSHDFDRLGNEVHTNYYRMMRIVLDAGYHGYVGVEYEGSQKSEPEGIRLTKQLLETVRETLSRA